jgi:hypothetical protein
MIQGQWSETVWNKLPDRFSNIDLDASKGMEVKFSKKTGGR